MLLGATAGAHSGEVVLKPRIQLVFLHIVSPHLKVNEFFFIGFHRFKIFKHVVLRHEMHHYISCSLIIKRLRVL